MGMVLCRYHGLPYLASWDHNFPGIDVVHALSILCFGNSALGFRLVEYFWQIATVFALYRMSRFWLSESGGLLATLVFALYYVHGSCAVMGQRDGFAILPILLASAALVIGFRSQALPKGLLIAGGVCYGIAASIRPTFALLLPVALFALFRFRSVRGRQAWGYASLGFVIVVFCFTFPYMLYPHGLEEAWDSAVRFNLDLYTPMVAHATASLWFTLYPVIAYSLLGGWILSMAIYHTKGWRVLGRPLPSREQWFLVSSFVALLFGILIMQALLTYQFTPFYALFMPVPAMLALDWKARLGRPGSIGFWILLLVMAAALYPWRMVIPFVSHDMSLRAAYTEESPDSTSGYLPTEAVVNYLLQNTSSNDVVEITSPMGALHWRLGRPSATQFTTDQPLLMVTPSGTFTDYEKRWRMEYIDRLKTVRPKFIVLSYDSKQVRQIPGFNELLQEHYALDTVLHQYILYKRTE